MSPPTLRAHAAAFLYLGPKKYCSQDRSIIVKTESNNPNTDILDLPPVAAWSPQHHPHVTHSEPVGHQGKNSQREQPTQVEENRSRGPWQHRITGRTRNNVETRRNVTCYGPLWSRLGPTDSKRKTHEEQASARTHARAPQCHSFSTWPLPLTCGGAVSRRPRC